MGFAGSTAATAVEDEFTEPYDITFVWKLPEGGSAPWNPFPNGQSQTLVDYVQITDGMAPNTIPNFYDQAECGGIYQIDSYRILDDGAHFAVLDWISRGELRPWTDGDLGANWEREYQDTNPEYSHDNWKNDGDFSFFTWFETPAEACDLAPVAPMVEQAVCTVPGGDVTDPSVTLADTAGITYTLDGTVAVGETVVVIAALDDDYANKGYMLAATDGWALSDDNKIATYTVELKDVPCDVTPPVEVAPVAPAVTDAVCEVPGDLTDPTITVAETEGVNYDVEGDIKAGSTLTVTATAEQGYMLAATDGWALSDDSKIATYTVELKDVPCDVTPPVEVAPVAPAVTDAVCEVPGDLTDPTVTVAETEGISYTRKGEVKAGSTVTVTASAQDGYRLKAAEGWTMNDDGTATYTVDLKQIDCSKNSTTPPLATTGGISAAGALMLAIGLIGVGASAMFIRRNKLT
ncbi:hypothetical protein ICL81_01375 [Leucobacter sp. cx-328]|nr:MULTISPECIES: hypothetical protein [unclassified Leucobacter]MBC9943180.1 hypothetical protein [Leucobacter sp. cx-328]